MAVKKCEECGDKVSTKAKLCPHCGAKVPQPTSAFTWLIAIVIFVPITFGIFSDTEQSGESPQGVGQIASTAVEVPAHIVASNTSLAPKDGRRVEIHSDNSELTRAECEILINQYINVAGPEGQVSVRKPDPQNIMTPWCVENFDGKGIFFTDD